MSPYAHTIIQTMNIQNFNKLKMPDSPGVYFFYKGKSVLYIGKATSLRDRVRSYFSKDLIHTRGMLLVDMVTQADSIKWQETDSVLEALILEAELIKKHQPKYNTKEKDNKSFLCVVITKEKLSKVLMVRGKDLKKEKYKNVFGPFTNGSQLREAMKIVRRIFPYFDVDSEKRQNRQFYKQLALIPEENYKNNLKNLVLFFQGKKKRIISNLRKEMLAYAKKKEFERADEVKRRIFALEHINDIALIKEDFFENASQKIPVRKVLGSPVQSAKAAGRPDHSSQEFSAALRVEAYDIAHMSGKNMVGVMTVVESGAPNKSEYKKFIIRTQSGANDTGALEEVLARRLRHTEWGMPSLIVLDGSVAQMNVGKRVLDRYQLKVPLVGVVKNEKHQPKAIIGDANIIKTHKKSILLANAEAHRFAITFYRQKSRKNMLK
jgi:excinuclease ABC subunit C